MSVLINFKICDNSKDCNGIKACPTGAFGWDEEKQTLKVNEDICINCGKCQCCDVGAIKVTYSEEEYEKVKKDIEDDPRTLNDLFVDRYGATPLQEMFMSDEDNIDNVANSPRPFVLELYKEDTIECLLKSIPIKEILQKFDKESTFRKIKVISNKLLDRYNIKELPALIFMENKVVLGKVEGYYEISQKEELLSLINNINEN